MLPASIPIIGCGGIATGQDALEFAKSGASLIQVYTSFSYDGPGAPRRIKDELASALQKDQTTWTAAVTQAVETRSLKKQSPVEIFHKQAEEMKAVVSKSLGLQATTMTLPSPGGTLQDLIKEAEKALGLAQ